MMRRWTTVSGRLFSNKSFLTTTKRHFTTSRHCFTAAVLSEDSKIAILSSIDHVQVLWNQGENQKALNEVDYELNVLEPLLEKVKGNADNEPFVLAALRKLIENKASMLFMLNRYNEAIPFVERAIRMHDQQFESLASSEKQSQNSNYLRKKLQLGLELALCLRYVGKFDQSVTLLTRYCDELSDLPVLVISLRERLGWGYLQRGIEFSNKAKMVSREERFSVLESAHSNLQQALHNFNVGLALAKEVSILENYEEFTKDDVRTVMDLLFSRAFCYREMAELELTREESSKLWEKACTDLEIIVDKDKTFYVASFHLAEMKAKLEKFDAAILYYDTFLDKFQDYVKEQKQSGSNIRAEELYIETRIKRSLCAMKIEDFPMAQDDLQHVVELITDLLSNTVHSPIMHPEKLLQFKAIAHNKLGYCYYRRYRYHDAIAENTKALGISPEMLEAYRDRLECHEALGHEAEASEDRRMVEFLKRKMAVSQPTI